MYCLPIAVTKKTLIFALILDNRCNMKWFKNLDWESIRLYVLIFLVVGGIFGFAAYVHDKNKDLTPLEKLDVSEFTYKGHQYIIFRDKNLLKNGSVVHNPDCKCFSIGRDSI